MNFWYLLPQEVVEASIAAGEKRFQTNSWTTGTDGIKNSGQGYIL